MALLPKGAWVLVADGEKAIFLENEGTPAAPKLRVIDKMKMDPAAISSLDPDKPGRIPDTGPGQLSAMEHPDLQRELRARFIADVAERLNKHVSKADVRRLVIAAPPQSLAILRENLSDAVEAALIAALPKTLTQHTLQKIGTLVAEDIDPL